MAFDDQHAVDKADQAAKRKQWTSPKVSTLEAGSAESGPSDSTDGVGAPS